MDEILYRAWPDICGNEQQLFGIIPVAPVTYGFIASTPYLVGKGHQARDTWVQGRVVQGGSVPWAASICQIIFSIL